MAHPPTSYLWVWGHCKQALSTWLEDLLGLLWLPWVVGQRLYETTGQLDKNCLSWVSIRKTGLKLGITSICRLVVFSNSGNYLDQLMERHVSELGRSYSNCANLRTVIWGFAKVSSCGCHSLRIWWALIFWGARIGGSKHNLSRAWAQTGPDLMEMDHVLSSRSELLLPWLIAQPVVTTKASYFANDFVRWWLILSKDHEEKLTDFIWWLRVDKTPRISCCPIILLS